MNCYFDSLKSLKFAVFEYLGLLDCWLPYDIRYRDPDLSTRIKRHVNRLRHDIHYCKFTIEDIFCKSSKYTRRKENMGAKTLRGSL